MFNDFNLGNIHCPCHNCKDRTMVCDTNCKKYRDYKADVEEFKKQYRIQKILGSKENK